MSNEGSKRSSSDLSDSWHITDGEPVEDDWVMIEDYFGKMTPIVKKKAEPKETLNTRLRKAIEAQAAQQQEKMAKEKKEREKMEQEEAKIS